MPSDLAAELEIAGRDPLLPIPRNPAMPADWAQEAVRRVGGGLANIVMAPRRAMEQGITSEEAVPWGLETALAMAGAGAPGAARGAAGAAGGRLMQPEGIRAFHSSPHDFERFDLSKVGTGEGGQSYGHGIYAAENPAVSGQGGQYWQAFKGRFGGNEAEAVHALQQAGFDRDAAIARLNKEMGGYIPGSTLHTSLSDAKKLLESGKPVGPRTYEVNIAAKPEEFLDWDKPFTKLPKEMQQTLIDMGAIAKSRAIPPAGEPLLPLKSYATGQSAYEALALKQQRNPADVSAALSEAGIPGIRYLDQGSRNRAMMKPEPHEFLNGQMGWKVNGPNGDVSFDTLPEAHAYIKSLRQGGTSNYVVFNPEIIDILRKYGVAGLSALPPAVASHVQSRLIPVDHDPFAGEGNQNQP